MIMYIFKTLFSLKLALSFIPIEAYIYITVRYLRCTALLCIIGIIFGIVSRLVSHIARKGEKHGFTTIFGIPSLLMFI
jgi:predicted exporter